MDDLKIPGRCLRRVFFRQLRARMAFTRRGWFRGISGFVLVFGMMFQLSNHVSLVYSYTNSLPYHFFLQLKNVKPLRGHYTCLHSPWHGNRVIKQVVGMEGDVLSYDPSGALQLDTLDASSLWLGRQLKIGKPKKRSKDGRSLTPLKPGIIPKGMVFVSGNHERSFDSRYEELGLVPEKNLQGRLIALV
jgi:conjugal transfer pilin signal peptidase TrbI